MISICFSINDQYVRQFAAAVVSILDHHRPEEFELFIWNDAISRANIRRLSSWLSQHNVHFEFLLPEDSYFTGKNLTASTRFPENVFYRFLIPERLAYLERVLYLDADLLVLSRLDALFHVDLSGYCMGLVPEFFEEEGKCRLRDAAIVRYYNTGVILFDVRQFRSLGVLSRLRPAAASKQIQLVLPDQDVLNMSCQDLIYPLPFIFNAQLQPASTRNLAAVEKCFEQIVILHFTGNFKPWKGKRIPFRNLYYKALASTPWSLSRFLLSLKDIVPYFYSCRRMDDYKITRLLGIVVRRKRKNR